MSTRTFRPGATMIPLVIWTFIVGMAGILIEYHALDLAKGTPERWAWQIAFTGCMVLGPAALIAHIARASLIRVSVDPSAGVFVRRGLIPWSEIRSVDYRSGPFKGSRPLGDISAAGNVPLGCLAFGGEGCLIGIAILFVGYIAYAFLLPVFTLFSPWHPRVIVHLKTGEDIIFRDLMDDAEFVAMVKRGLGDPTS